MLFIALVLFIAIYPSAIHSECKCTVAGKPAIPEDMEMDDFDVCYKAKNCKWEPQIEMDRFLKLFTIPIIHEVTPDHCAFTATFCVAENLGIKTGWTRGIWNARAKAIDNLFKGYIKLGYAPMRENINKKGAFTADMMQRMLRTVGLNFGVVNSGVVSYPTIYKYNFFMQNRDFSDLSKNYFKKILMGTTKFLNSEGKKKPMVALLLNQADSPRAEAKPDHMTAVVKITDPKTSYTAYYYADSNVHDIKHLINGKSPPLTNIYKGNEIDNSASGKKPKGFEFGYAVDHTLMLGSDIDVVAQWLEDKMKNRPQVYLKPTEMTTKKQQLNPENAGGGIDMLVVVQDNAIPWHVMLAGLKELTKTKDTFPGMTAKMGEYNQLEENAMSEGFVGDNTNWIFVMYGMELALIMFVFLIGSCMIGGVVGFVCNFVIHKYKI